MASAADIRVVHATWGRFHLDLTRELETRGLLMKAFMTYPPRLLRNELLPADKLEYRWRLHFPLVALQRQGLRPGGLQTAWQRAIVRDYSAWMERRLPPCDVFVAMSGIGLTGGRLTRRRGGKYICDRGSSHIRYGENLLMTEHAKWGMNFPKSDPQDLAVEEKEYEEADILCAHSTFARNTFIESGLPPEKVVSAPFGINLQRYHRVSGPPEGEFRVLFVGQVNLRKGVPYLLEAFAALRHPKKSLTIIGSVPPEMKLWLSGRPLDRVTFKTHVSHEELLRHFSESHVHVLASIEDGFGAVQAQALACGCPIISTTNSGGPDLITPGQEGFIVPIRDAKAIAACLEELAQDPARRQRMSDDALLCVKRIGGTRDFGDKMEKVIRQLARP